MFSLWIQTRFFHMNYLNSPYKHKARQVLKTIFHCWQDSCPNSVADIGLDLFGWRGRYPCLMVRNCASTWWSRCPLRSSGGWSGGVLKVREKNNDYVRGLSAVIVPGSSLPVWVGSLRYMTTHFQQACWQLGSLEWVYTRKKHIRLGGKTHTHRSKAWKISEIWTVGVCTKKQKSYAHPLVASSMCVSGTILLTRCAYWAFHDQAFVVSMKFLDDRQFKTRRFKFRTTRDFSRINRTLLKCW